ncbi:MAG TPA: hypothetical protein VJ914_24020 [Pseudonocardiaceae bacterium]|nr:hypothetical protein [Pseudonocardiaceae bacterium]
MELINDLQVVDQSQADLKEVLQIAFVSAYRCPSTEFTSPETDEFQISWDVPQGE